MACQGSIMVDDYCWLPDEFPEEAFFLGEVGEEGGKGPGLVSSVGPVDRVSRGLLSPFPGEFPYDLESSLSPSPLGSAAGTDSDDEEYEELVAGLAQKMVARKLRLLEAEEAAGAWLPPPGFAGETHKMSAGMRQYSPQSTLSAAGSWAALGGARSPTDRDYLLLAPRKRDDSALDLLSAAALEVERMRLRDGAAELRRALAGAGDGRGLLPGPRPSTSPHLNTISAAAAASLNKPGAGSFFANPAHTLRQPQQLQPTQPLPRPIPVPGPAAAWGPRQNRGITPGSGMGLSGAAAAGGRVPAARPLGPAYTCPPSTWPLPPQHNQPLGGSGMRAVFLGAPGARRESSGTGVFLPRRDGNPPASKKKPACSTVLLPARVVQALNLNLDDIGALPVSHGAGFALNNELIRARSRMTQTQQPQPQPLPQRVQSNAAAAATLQRYPHRPSNHHNHLSTLPAPAPAPAPALSPEIMLPPEWSY